MSDAAEQIAKMMTIPAIHNMPGFALTESIVKLDNVMKAAAASDKLFRENMFKATTTPTIALQAAVQAVFERQNASFKGLLTGLAIVKSEPPVAFPGFGNYPATRSQQAQKPVTPTFLLPDEVAQSRSYFARLIAELKTLPPPDIITVLDIQLSQHSNTRELFLARLIHYLAGGQTFAPTCWQVITFWLNSMRPSVSTPTWQQPMITDAAATPTQSSAFKASVSAASFEETKPERRSIRIVSWAAVLRPPLNKSSLYSTLTGLGLLTSAGELTELGRDAAPRVWAGVVAALREKNYIIHDYTATYKALMSELRIKLSVRSLNPSQGLPVEAENIKRATLDELHRVLG